MSRRKDQALPGNGGEFAELPREEAEVSLADDSVATEIGIARQYGERTATALNEMIRLCAVGQRLVERGHDWYVADPDNVPGLAAEGLIIKMGENVSRVSPELERDHPEIPWRVIKEMRNRLTHYYEATDYEVVWSTLESDFPGISEMFHVLLGRRR